MNRMGGTCSMQRQRALWHREEQRAMERRANLSPSGASERPTMRRSSRHSVVSMVPNSSIESLYPVQDNYINEDDGRRSPKRLAELCTDAVCRSLPNLDGELPRGLPQDVVDDIVNSLYKHGALNATTLGCLKNCELGKLILCGCRGVTDEWLEPFAGTKKSAYYTVDRDRVESMDLDCSKKSHEFICDTRFDALRAQRDEGIAGSTSSSRSTSSFVSANSNLDPETEHTIDDNDAVSYAAMTAEDVTMTENRMALDTPGYCSATANLTILDLRGSQRLTDKGLLKLQDLCQLEVAKLDNCHSLVGRGLLAFSMSHRLHTIGLSGCRRLTDEAIINVSHLVSLETLNLEGCRCLTDRSLAAISGLVELRKLDLSQCDMITDTGLEHLESIENLEELSLGWCRSITNRGLDLLTGQPGRSGLMRVLRLARCMITDEGVEFLGRLTSLEELDLNGCSNVGSATLCRVCERMPQLQTLDVSYCPGILRTSWQGKINNLKTLELCYSGVKDSHLSKLHSLPNLEEINLDSCPVGDFAIAHLAENDVVPNLRSLDLADTDLTDIGMAHLPKFKHLTRLSLFYCNITNEGLRHISELTSLEELNLDSREISDAGLCHLRKLKKLKCLDIFSGKITDAGCAHISRIGPSLEALEICGGGVGDLGCTLLSGLENLTSLNLSQNERITNRGASSFSGLQHLKQLNLSNTRVDASSHLRLPKSLQSLALYGCRGIENGSGVAVLQTNLPSLKCLRLSLNQHSTEDGMMVGIGLDEGDDTFDELDPQGRAGVGGVAYSTSRQVTQHANDNDSENSFMEEAQNQVDDESFYSDHD